MQVRAKLGYHVNGRKRGQTFFSDYIGASINLMDKEGGGVPKRPQRERGLLMPGGRGSQKYKKPDQRGALGCFNLCSDVPKVKNFICSPTDPLIWFTRFPKWPKNWKSMHICEPKQKIGGGAYEILDFWHITT